MQIPSRLALVLAVPLVALTLPPGAARAQEPPPVVRTIDTTIVRDSLRADSVRIRMDSITGQQRADSVAERLRADSLAARARADSLTPRAGADSSAAPSTSDTSAARPAPARSAPRSRNAPIVTDDSVRYAADTTWPVRGPDPLEGAILPHKRIVAYYGNPLSKRMGILGEIPPDSMLAHLDRVVAAWEAADPSTPVQPALHLVAMVAQADAGADGKYRAKMSDELIERVASWAARRDALVFLDLQVGLSTIQAELPKFAKFLERPNFHLGIDPEFMMKSTHAPGKRIGRTDAADVNYAVRFLADLVEKHGLPPKILVVHRFTEGMLTNAQKIELDPRVQVVIHMDGWGPPRLKRDSYREYVYSQPVQFTGFKVFYKNDTRSGTPIMKPSEILKLWPRPLYIQYQ